MIAVVDSQSPRADLDSVYRSVPSILTEREVGFENNLSDTLKGILKLVVLACISMIQLLALSLTISVTVSNLVTTRTSVGGGAATGLAQRAHIEQGIGVAQSSCLNAM